MCTTNLVQVRPATVEWAVCLYNCLDNRCCLLWTQGALLERRLEALAEQLEMKDAQLAEVLTAANLEPSTLQVRLWVKDHLTCLQAHAGCRHAPWICDASARFQTGTHYHYHYHLHPHVILQLPPCHPHAN